MLTNWARNWWTLILRGIAAILFGVLTFVRPGISLVALILLFASYALVDGIFNVVGAIRGATEHQRWGLLLFEGIVSIGVSIVTLMWPGLTALALLYWIAAWALVTGALEIAAAIRLRDEIKGEWLLGLAGLLSIAFGVLLIAAPGAGALALLFWIGAYAFVFGGVLIALGIRVHSWEQREGLQPPQPQTPVPA